MTTTIKERPYKENVTTQWVIDPLLSEIAFKVPYSMTKILKGRFNEFGATLCTEGKNYMSFEIDFWLNTNSINTRDKTRDSHLKGADFFDIEKYKQITFSGTSYEAKNTEGHYILTGDLMIKGIIKQIKMDVFFGGKMTDAWGNQRASYTVCGKINRKDWGLKWNKLLDNGGVMVSNEVSFNCEIQWITDTES